MPCGALTLLLAALLPPLAVRPWLEVAKPEPEVLHAVALLLPLPPSLGLGVGLGVGLGLRPGLDILPPPDDHGLGAARSVLGLGHVQENGVWKGSEETLD